MKKLSVLTLCVLCLPSLLLAKKAVVMDEEAIKHELMAGGASEAEAEEQAHATVSAHESESEMKESKTTMPTKQMRRSKSTASKRTMYHRNENDPSKLSGMGTVSAT